MSDNGSTPQRNVDKFILEVLKDWEECGFKDLSLWETFQDTFDGFTEEDFRLAKINNQRRLWDYLRKFSVWIRRQKRYSIVRLLYDALLEEEPTPWMEAEITACEENENFDSYKISQLIDSDFDRKPRKSRALTPTSPTGPPPVATSPTLAPSAPSPFAPPSSFPGPSAPVPANTPIYPTHILGTGFPTAAHTPPGTRPSPGAYMQPPSTGFLPAAYPPPGTGPTSPAYIQPLRTEPIPAVYTAPEAYMQSFGTTPGIYMKSSGPPSAAYIQPTRRSTSAAYIQPSGPTSAAYIQPPGTGLHTPGIGPTSAA